MTRLIRIAKNISFNVPFVWLMSIILFSGCESLINDLDPDKLPKTEAKLAVSCYISPQSAVIEAIITESQPLLGPANSNTIFIPNAEVYLADANNRVRLSYVDSASTYRADTSEFKIRPGGTYTLTVSDGKRSVKATCTVPSKVAQITNVTADKIPGYAGNDTLMRIRFSWQDLKGETNYYAVRGSYIFESTGPQYYPETGDVLPFRYKSRQEMFYGRDTYNDINIDGITFNGPEARIYTPQKMNITYVDKNGVQKSIYNDPKFSDVRVEVMSIDVNYYKFYRSLNNTDNDNPFVEPTLVYNNVEGGLGCFAAFNVSGVTINLE
jgi:hypothetical protein